MELGFALCGSYCTYRAVFPVLEKLCKSCRITPIFSDNSWKTDTRFGKAADWVEKAEALTGNTPLHTIPEVEPIGPRRLLDALVIAPCTGNTLAKLAHGIADTPVTLAVKSHLRNNRPVIVAVSTNDGLAAAAENIGRLLARRYFYFVPFRQDDPKAKPASLVADFSLLPETLALAMEGKQLQPILR